MAPAPTDIRNMRASELFRAACYPFLRRQKEDKENVAPATWKRMATAVLVSACCITALVALSQACLTVGFKHPEAINTRASSRAVLLQRTSSSDAAVVPPNPTRQMYQNEISYLPACPFVRKPHQSEDLTLRLKSWLGLESSCISNPSVVALPDQVLLMSIRVYSSRYGTPCTRSGAPGGQWAEGWSGQGGLAMVLLRRNSPDNYTLLGQLVRVKDNAEDPRLFTDDKAKIRMTYNRWRGGDASMQGFKRLQRRSMHVVEVKIDMHSRTITLDNEQELLFLQQKRDEKNWVPWEGTTLMTYPQYPGFAPHTVLDWSTYEMPQDQLAYKAATPIPFVQRFREAMGGWIRFSGGTPGIRLDRGRFLAVGHAVGDLTCFHQHIETDAHEMLSTTSVSSGPATSTTSRKLGNSGRKQVNEAEDAQAGTGQSQQQEAEQALPNVTRHACNASLATPTDEHNWLAHFQNHSHKLPYHHPYWDYFFFLYTWSAQAPHEVLQISHAFIPYDADDHTGVHFPTGLQLLPDSSSVLLTYGKDDSHVMALTLSLSAVEEYLMPLASLNPQEYRFCSVRQERPLDVWK